MVRWTVTLAVAVMVVGCGASPEPVEHTLVQAKGCDGCHGDNLQGTATAPSLEDLQAHWDAESLTAYLREPAAVRAESSRLQVQNGRYPVEMPAIEGTDEELRRLAEILLSE